MSPKGKKRLILDFKYINNHLFKNKIKFDDWNSFQNYFESNKGYLFKFDLKSRYHQTYISFSWGINQQTRYFVFIVLHFGLSFGLSVYQSTPAINKISVSARDKDSLFFR